MPMFSVSCDDIFLSPSTLPSLDAMVVSVRCCCFVCLLRLPGEAMAERRRVGFLCGFVWTTDAQLWEEVFDGVLNRFMAASLIFYESVDVE